MVTYKYVNPFRAKFISGSIKSHFSTIIHQCVYEMESLIVDESDPFFL